MRSTFFTRRALPILCLIFFLVPFGLRGARLSLDRMKNDVKDWLPDSFKETKELEWFAEHFMGERFVVATWPGCSEDDPRYHQMLQRLEQDVAPPTLPPLPLDPQARDEEQARRLGTRLGLFYTGDYQENWGGRGERWLRGHKNTWYYVTPDGKLYKWDVGDNVVGRLIRGLRRWAGAEKADGTLVADWSPAEGTRFFDDPRLLTARRFSSVMTGPMAVERMARPGGALWPRGNVAEEDKPLLARRLAVERLAGSMFGALVPEQFDWTAATLEQCLPEKSRQALPVQWQEVAEEKIQRLAEIYHDGDRAALAAASELQRRRHWLSLCDELGVEPPAPLTCFIVTLNEAGKRDLSRVCGRELLGKPRGQLLAIAEDCGVRAIGEQSELHLGGPPVDNVAIDEEGSITLMRLVGYSAVLGVVLSYFSFRSMVVTIMVFLVGGISALTSLAIVYWTGASVDAILLSMPSLVYVLGLSGAVHIVNYYRDAAQETGLLGAPEKALSHGWGPCTLAAFTTAIGLLSLYTSNILPIRKFGLFSALGVMATLMLLFTYLPSALALWPPGYHQRRRQEMSGLAAAVGRFWDRVGGFVTRRYGLVIAVCLLFMAAMSLGLTKIQTSVQLLKLFDQDAKIINDYRWLENNVGELVPMEVIVRLPPSRIAAAEQEGAEPPEAAAAEIEDEIEDVVEQAVDFTLLERMELTHHVQTAIEREFGEAGQDKVGRGISAATFAFNPDSVEEGGVRRSVANRLLQQHYDELLELDYLRLDTAEGHEGSELWRISLRLGALNDVDYGQFIHELADVVEPVLSAYRHRDNIMRQITYSRHARGDDRGFEGANILLLGAPHPDAAGEAAAEHTAADDTAAADDAADAGEAGIDQTRVFTETLQELLVNANFVGSSAPMWIDPDQRLLSEMFPTQEEAAAALQQHIDCVVLVRGHEDYDIEFLQANARTFVDARDHVYRRPLGDAVRLASARPAEGPAASLTAAQRGGEIPQAIYTGVVPVVYKAQRTLLRSLAESIGWAFVMIAAVMMVLLRSGRWRPDTAISFRGGMLSMIPNVFPVVVIFGFMGHYGVIVDIGSMMTASVAMGVAVDDTIHFLTWFRSGIKSGLSRTGAIKLAYGRCATAMTQTTLIGGVGLSVFAVSTFTPTQRFGILMLCMLAAALVGDLILLPALLASRWGRYFCPSIDNHKQDRPEGAGGEAARQPRGAELPAAIRCDAGRDRSQDGGGPAPPPHSSILVSLRRLMRRRG